MGYWTYVKHRLDYVSFRQLMIDILSKTGFHFEPFYLLLEGLSDDGSLLWRNLPEGYTIGFLGSEEMHLISALPERRISERELRKRLKEGKRCLGVKHRNDLVAFTWYDLQQCTYPGCVFELKDNEAYLFDAHTAVAYRGKGIAPVVRYQSYRELAGIGKTRLYSISLKYNVHAIRFKQKLNARIIEEGIHIRLFNKWNFVKKRRYVS